ncbi:uncharacterized protein LOC128201190 [Galleria mellonella]|uniref:Uncharacterized protein LOC128201190 n=1 Tax=Galleria mellonella TaxID=7137 RepID=A0ABM3MPP3_GALME|nr:uncharacterized protein LOC128201190 [Galleria mellonella]
MFWSRWVREYLPGLLPRRSSSSSSAPSISIEDVVLIADGDLPRGTWPRGHVVALFLGRDNFVRVADVQMVSGTLRRPLKKLFNAVLSKLPIVLKSRWYDFAVIHEYSGQSKLEMLAEFLNREVEVQAKFGIVDIFNFNMTFNFDRHKKLERVNAVEVCDSFDTGLHNYNTCRVKGVCTIVGCSRKHHKILHNSNFTHSIASTQESGESSSHAVDNNADQPRSELVTQTSSDNSINVTALTSRRQSNISNILTAEDLNLAESHILRRSQEDDFQEEIAYIANNRPLNLRVVSASCHHKLVLTNLYISGRITAVLDVNEEDKFSIFFRWKHPSILLLIHYYHVRTPHGNTETIVNELRQKYWILGLRNAVRSIAHSWQLLTSDTAIEI